MTRSVLIATVIAAVMLIPVAVWQGDILIISLAGLIPFGVDWKKGNLE